MTDATNVAVMPMRGFVQNGLLLTPPSGRQSCLPSSLGVHARVDAFSRD